jgi:subtilase family serine protease
MPVGADTGEAAVLRYRKNTFAFVLTVLAAAGGLVASAIPGGASAPSMTTVWVAKSACAAAAPDHMSCFAQKIVAKRVTTAKANQLPAVARVRPSFGNGPAGGFTPGEVAKAYGFNPNGSTNQTVAIVDAYRDPSVLADLNHFDSQYGLPPETASSFTVVNQTGGSVSAINTDVGWAGETALDVDAVRGLCHKCKILLVEATTNDNANLGAAVNYAAAHAKIVSNSYGGPETDPENTPAVKADYDHHGVAILASTGDDGWYAWDQSNIGCPNSCTTVPTDDVPSTPASYNTVVGVGGTALYVNPNGTRSLERVWNENGPAGVWGFNLGAPIGAAGSGCSTQINGQLWQQKVAGYTSLGCGTTRRNGVDIAAIADPFTGYDIYETTATWCASGNQDDNGNACPTTDPLWETFGGTSLASPVIGAMWALAGGPGAVKYPALSLYGHFKSGHPTYDVTVGGTGLCDTATPGFCSGGDNPNSWIAGQDLDCGWSTTNLANTNFLANHYQCYAKPGYDGVSGVGVPIGLTVFKPMSPTAKITTSGTITHRVSHSFSGASSTDPFPGGAIVSYHWNWGDGNSSTGKTASHTYSTAGSRTITLTVTDNYGRVGSKKLTVTVH